MKRQRIPKKPICIRNIKIKSEQTNCLDVQFTIFCYVIIHTKHVIKAWRLVSYLINNTCIEHEIKKKPLNQNRMEQK